MTYDQVLVFHTIIATGSFKAAAAELHKTQPAISQAIKKLEDEMDFPLFDRSHYRPQLTEHGKVFFERSHRLISGMSELEGLTKSFRDKDEPVISVSVDGISPLPKLLSLLKCFGETYPFTKLNLEIDILGESERRVLEKEVLMGVTHFLSRPDHLEIIPITSVHMIPVMNKDLYIEKKVSSQRDLLDIDQIVVSNKQKHSNVSFGLLDSGKKWRLNDSNFKKDVIVAGLGWGHLAEHTIEQELKSGKLIVLDFEDIHPRELAIQLIRLKRHSFGPVAKSLWNELASLRD